MEENEIENKIEFDMQKILEQSTPTIEEIAKKIEKEEHRHLIKEKNGTFREETDEEFKNRLMQKYLDTDERMHEYQEWEEDYAEMQTEWYLDNIGEI